MVDLPVLENRLLSIIPVARNALRPSRTRKENLQKRGTGYGFGDAIVSKIATIPGGDECFLSKPLFTIGRVTWDWRRRNVWKQLMAEHPSTKLGVYFWTSATSLVDLLCFFTLFEALMRSQMRGHTAGNHPGPSTPLFSRVVRHEDRLPGNLCHSVPVVALSCNPQVQRMYNTPDR